MKVPFAIRAIPSLTYRAWFTPPPVDPTVVDRDRETTSGLGTFGVGDVTGFETGSGPVVLALHGWGGRPAQMVTLARAVADVGYRVVIPELPGHAGGEKTDIKEVTAQVRGLIGHVGAPEIVIAHSFAALVMRLLLEDEAPRGAILIAPALDVDDALAVFGDRLRLLPWARKRLRSRLGSWDPALWTVLCGVHPEQMQGTEFLIIHDPDDSDTSFRLSAELAALRPSTRLIPAHGTGHNRILRDQAVIDRSIRFITSEHAGMASG